MSVVKIYRGQSVAWPLVLKSGGVAMDITGAVWEVLEPTANPTITIEVTNPAAGQSVLRIDREQTKVMKTIPRTIRARLNFPDGSAIAIHPIKVEVV